MEIIKTPLKDCLVIKMPKFGDERGFFLESYNKSKLSDYGIEFDVKQVNFAKSQKNVLRGMHFQKETFAQAKLVGVICGAVLDVVVDIRKDSPTYLKHFKYELSSPEILLLVPRGFAHGYYTLADDTVFHYAVDNFYSPENEGGILYNDPKLNIDWELKETPLVSEKDLKHKNL
jgi:dTDP-4-dehydrorhamnose 3,5-epimerase